MNTSLNFSIFKNKYFLIFIFSFLASFLPQFIPVNEELLFIDIEATVDEGHVFQIFIHDVPTSHPVRKGEKTVYSLQRKSESFTGFRIDPSDQIKSKFKIHSLAIKTSLGELVFQTNDFQGWNFKDIQASEKVDDRFFSTSSDPMILAPDGLISYQKEPASLFQTFFLKMKESPGRITILFVIFSLISLFSSSKKQATVLVMSLLIYFTTAPSIYKWIYDFSFEWLPSSAESVGWVNFNGFPKAIDFAFFSALILSFTLLGMIYSRFHEENKIQFQNEYLPVYFRKTLTNFHILLLCGLAVVLLFPDFQTNYERIINNFKILDWDEMNVFSWKYFFERGLVPLKDFWYPYGGQNVVSGPFWQDSIILLLHRLTYCLLFTFSLLNFFSKKTWPIVIVLFSLLLTYWFDLNLGADRYFSSFAAFCFFASCWAGNGFSFKKILILFGSIVWLCLWEPHQLIYFAIGFGAYALSDVIISAMNSDLPEHKFRSLSYVLITALLSIFFSFLLYYASGKLPGLFSFFDQTGGYSINASLPAEFESVLKDPFSYAGNVFHLYFLLISTTSFLLLKSFKTHKREISFLIGSIVYLLPLIFKNLIRPHMGQQIIGIELIIFAIFTFLAPVIYIKRISSIFIAITFGLILGLSLRDSRLQRVLNIGEKTLKSITSPFTVDKAYFETSKSELAKKYFALNSISVAGITLDKIEHYVSTNYPKDRFFILGDISAVYLALNQIPPYTVSFYDGAHIQLQKQLLEWIIKNDISVILWDWKNKSFDGVPFIVKNPSIFRHIIDSYEFDSEFGEFHFLKRKDQNKNINIPYWAKHLGTSIDFGYLGSNPSLKFLEDCPKQDDSQCEEFLEIKSTQNSKNNLAVFSEKDKISFQIEFKLLNEDRFLIPTNYIWFWTSIKHNKDPIFPNNDYKLIYKRKIKGVLY